MEQLREITTFDLDKSKSHVLLFSFDIAICPLQAGAPSGMTVNFSPNPIAAPGAGSSTMTSAVVATVTAATTPNLILSPTWQSPAVAQP